MLCQSLLVSEYPGVQCFPVGMADGGRDATARSGSHADMVFQVKFTSKPSSIKDPVKWITDSIDGELEKIRRLQERGVTKYFLITNMPPSANLDTGMIDKVDRYLRQHVPIDAQCWWRDDLDRRLDNNYDLKLRYPTLLNGPDLLRLVVERMGPDESRRRRQRALTSYFAHQFDQDLSIRFKQADLLPSSLFDLFVDVPVALTLSSDRDNDESLRHYVDAVNRGLRLEDQDSSVRTISHGVVYRAVHGDAADSLPERYYTFGEFRSPLAGGADLLLDAEFIDSFSRIVLEGAPGQGKSTLAQYIAQVHRARLLQHDDVKLPSGHASSAVMVPFKIELRDLASWLNGFDPWSGKAGTPHEGKRSLEGALAAHVERYSGGHEFTVADVAFLVEEHPVLVILDALDEVADLEDREKVVEEVTAAATRLSQNAHRVRFLVTSRPTAVSNAPSFSRQRFQHLRLAAITPEIALEYASRWGKARNLKKQDIVEIRDILSHKMSAPHMAELAKNTMQLSILLSLIYHKGSSLPDKRTELYDAYVDSFFNREVEKSKIVRENRNLLISIHQHLAFYIHARAEGQRTTGRIDRDELHAVVRARLRVLRQPEDLFDDLLTGMVERVVALVSRVEGTYEFEVQPLREYFAARYLYDTAPYTSATLSASGTKPDRFEGIAPNPYWLNVTRFFAGCFTVGELLDLSERVSVLCGRPEFRGLSYPRVLALSLLQDWVFFQSVPATERLIDRLFDQAGIRWAERRTRGHALAFGAESDVNVSLVGKAGGSYLVDKLWEIVESESPSERVRAACDVIRSQKANNSISVDEMWQRTLESKQTTQEKCDWIVIGGWLGVFTQMRPGQLAADDTSLMEILPSLVESGANFDSCSATLVRAAADCVLSDSLSASPGGFLSRLAFMVNPTLWTMFSQDGHPSVQRYMETALSNMRATSPSETFEAVSQLGSRMLQAAAVETTDNLTFWKGFLGDLNSHFGENWSGVCIGIASGAIRSPKERGAGADRLFDRNFSFVDRVRNAKRRSKQVSWWSSQLAEAASDLDRLTWLAMVYVWAEPETISQLWGLIESTIGDTSEQDRHRLYQLTRISFRFSPRSTKFIPIDRKSSVFSSQDDLMRSLFFERIEPCVEKDRFVLRAGKMENNARLAGLVIDHAWERFFAGSMSETDFMSTVDRQYAPGVFPLAHDSRHAFKMGKVKPLAENAMERPWDMPSNVLAVAEYYFSRRSVQIKPVLRIAEEQGWF